MTSRRDAETQRRRGRTKRVRRKIFESELCVSASLREYFLIAVSVELGLEAIRGTALVLAASPRDTFKDAV
jgi:hypothetical protein